MNKTKIEWCDYTTNPVKGLCPVACSYCYARAMYRRFKWNPTIRWEPETLLDLSVVPDGSRVFIGSTIELFHEDTIQWMPYILECIKRAPWQTSILLTKQPQNLIKFSPFPDNCWVGVTATHYKHFENAIWYLSQIEATVRFISLEPLLSRIPPIDESYVDWMREAWTKIDWLIIGAQTKPYKPPKIEWVQEIELSARKAGIPIFEKNNLQGLLNRDLIQELPCVK